MKETQPTFQDSLGILSSFLDFLSLSFQRKVAFSWQNPHRVFQPKHKTWISIQSDIDWIQYLNISPDCAIPENIHTHTIGNFKGKEGLKSPNA